MNNNIADDGTVEEDPTPSQQIMIDAFMEAHPNFNDTVLMKTVRDWYSEKHSVHRKFS